MRCTNEFAKSYYFQKTEWNTWTFLCLGGWVEGETNQEDVGDTEEAEDISNNPAFGPVTPSTPSTPMTCQSHTKSYVDFFLIDFKDF